MSFPGYPLTDRHYTAFGKIVSRFALCVIGFKVLLSALVGTRRMHIQLLTEPYGSRELAKAV